MHFGVLIQFIANNIVNNNLAESIMLCVGLIVLVYYGFGTDSMAANSARAADGRASYIVYKNEKTAGITLIIIVALMTCIFSTLDNAVTLVTRGRKCRYWTNTKSYPCCKRSYCRICVWN